MLHQTRNHYFLLTFFAFLISCKSPVSEVQSAKSIIKDSLNVFFNSFTVKGIDSIATMITKNVMEKKGVHIEKIAPTNGGKENFAYEHYSLYSFWLSTSRNAKYGLQVLNEAGDIFGYNSRFFFDKAIVWAYIETQGSRDSLYSNLNIAIMKDPLNSYLFGVRSQFLIQEGKIREALEDIEHAILLSPHDTSFVNLRGVYKAQNHDFVGALHDLEGVASKNHNNPNVHLYRAIAHNKLKNYKEAIIESNNYLTYDKNKAIIYTIRGNAKYMLGDEAGGLEDVRNAAVLGDKSAIEFINQRDLNLRQDK